MIKRKVNKKMEETEIILEENGETGIVEDEEEEGAE